MARTGRFLRTLLAVLPAALAGPGCHALSSERTSADDSRTPDPDAKAVRVEVTPARGSGKVGTEQVLVATVYDGDGKPRSRRKVEWAVDGPGTVVAVDESGWLRGRGEKVDDTHAVSHTDYREHTVTHGKHEFTVGPGQTWLVVTSEAPGEVKVTARAPEAADPDHGRAVAALTFDGVPVADPRPEPAGRKDSDREDAGLTSRAGRGRPEAPPPAPRPADETAELTLDVQAPKVAGVGAEAPLTVVLANAGPAVSAPATVRLTLPDTAEVVSTEPPPTVRQSRELTWNLGGLTGGKAERLRVVVRPTRPGGLTLTTTAETTGGLYAERTTRIDAGTAGLQLTAEAPGAADVGEAVTVQVGVTNRGSVPLANATAWVGFDQGLSHGSDGPQTEVAVGTVGPGETKRVDVRLTAKQTGRHAVRVTATADGGLTDRVETTIDVRREALALAITGPEKVTLNQDAAWQVRVTNAGDSPVSGAAVRATLPRALRAKTASDGGRVVGPDGVEWSVGSLAAGETRTLRLTAAGADIASRAVLTATATGGQPRGPTADAEAVVAVAGQPAVVLETADLPPTVPVGGRVPVRVTVRNRGTGPARAVEVVVTATDELSAVGGIGADRKAAAATATKVTFGTLAELPPGSSAVFVAEVEGAKPGAGRVQVEARAAHLTQPLREEQPARVVGR